ncbi:MAG: DUF4199 domain-containing protein [Gemmatimonadetes bacterium]|nr:DUF4199 domain-containing protein [Gemmatimonadota bacterium]
MRKTVLTFGLFAGAVLSLGMAVPMLFFDDLGFDTGEILGYTTMVAAFAVVYFAVRSYRENVGHGVISFGRAFRLGIGIIAIANVCYVATWQVIYATAMPDFMEKYSAHTIEKAKTDGTPAAELEKLTADMAKWTELYKNPLIRSGITFLEPPPVGLLVVLVSAALLRRTDATPA